MTPTILTPLLDGLDIVGVAIFALTGALVAARQQQTFVTMAFFALMTGVGGGTVRDLLIGAPVFWIDQPWVAPACLVTALIAWFTPARWWEGQLLDHADGLGLVAYAIIGAAKALSYGVPAVPAVLMGVVTGTVGGVLRDVIAGRPSVIMRPEIYVTAAALAAAIAVAGEHFGLPRAVAWTAALVAGYSLRALAIEKQLALPAYRERSDQSPDP